MAYTGPVFATGPAQKRDDGVVLEMLKMMRDSAQREWQPGELGNKYGFRNLGAAQWRGYIDERRSMNGEGGYTFLALTLAGERHLRKSEERAA